MLLQNLTWRTWLSLIIIRKGAISDRLIDYFFKSIKTILCFWLLFRPRLCFFFLWNARLPSVLQILNYSRNYPVRVVILHFDINLSHLRVTVCNCDCSLLYRDSSNTSSLVAAAAIAAAATVTTCNNSKCITPWDAQLRAITPWSNPVSCHQTLPDASTGGELSTIDAYGSRRAPTFSQTWTRRNSFTTRAGMDYSAVKLVRRGNPNSKDLSYTYLAQWTKLLPLFNRQAYSFDYWRKFLVLPRFICSKERFSILLSHLKSKLVEITCITTRYLITLIYIKTTKSLRIIVNFNYQTKF